MGMIKAGDDRCVTEPLTRIKKQNSPTVPVAHQQQFLAHPGQASWTSESGPNLFNFKPVNRFCVQWFCVGVDFTGDDEEQQQQHCWSDLLSKAHVFWKRGVHIKPL